jgi:hypothetical protein
VLAPHGDTDAPDKSCIGWAPGISGSSWAWGVGSDLDNLVFWFVTMKNGWVGTIVSLPCPLPASYVLIGPFCNSWRLPVLLYFHKSYHWQKATAKTSTSDILSAKERPIMSLRNPQKPIARAKPRFEEGSQIHGMVHA